MSINLRSLESTWLPLTSWCSECGAKLNGDPFVDSTCLARCGACFHLLQREIESEPRTSLVRFEPSGLVPSKTGDSASGMCPWWLDLRRAERVHVSDAWLRDESAPIVPCERRVHEDEDHRWDLGRPAVA